MINTSRNAAPFPKSSRPLNVFWLKTPRKHKKMLNSASNSCINNMSNNNFPPISLFNSESSKQRLRGQNATVLAHYAQWASHMLTLTFEDNARGNTPNELEIQKTLRHLKATLNYAVWGKRTRYNAKANILFIPVVEGANGNKRVHVHILLGNVGDVYKVNAFIRSYVYKSRNLGTKYDITDVTSVDGISWYLTKETQSINCDAVRWESALIPGALIPKRYTLGTA
jgi:hypothetical protein